MYKYDWLPYVIIRDYVNKPLGIIQNFGFFGVAIFFLVSGFIITHAVQREDRISFFVKRVFRIYPPLIATVFATLALHWLEYRATGIRDATAVFQPYETLLSTLGLSALFNANGVLSVGWTLTIELLFYLHVLLLNPLVRRSAFWAVATFVLWPTVLIRLCIVWGLSQVIVLNVGQLAVVSEYLPVFAMGMAVYYAWSGRLSVGQAAMLIAAAWLAMVYNLSLLQPFDIPPPTSHPAQVAYALVVFLAALWAWQGAARNPRSLRFFANISYSLYLIHYPFGLLAMDRLYPIVGFTAAAALSLSLVIGLSYLSFCLIEAPSQRLARQILLPRRQIEAKLPETQPVS